ncbi:sensor histidine kinase [Halovulum sp. GXIMD14794]
MTEGEGIPAGDLLDLFADPAALFDADGVLTARNDAFARTFAQIAEFTRPGTAWSMFLAEAERHQLLPTSTVQALRLIEEQAFDEASGIGHTVEARLPSGEMLALDLRPIGRNGFALIGHAAPDTEARQRTESEVEELMAKVLQACPTSLTMSRIGDGRILYRSPAATELLGKGRNSSEHFARREERADFITTLLPDARVDDMRITGRRPDGSEFPASISARLIDYRGEDVLVSSMVDLTEEISLQRQLARQKEEVFRAEKLAALGELLAGVAHELNNPLSIVVGNAVMLREEENLSPDVMRRLERLGDAAERCVRIVRTFLSMARERPLEIEALAIDDVIETAMDALRASETGTEAEMHARIAPRLPPVRADEVQIVQVLTNLLSNAQQAIGAEGRGGGIGISARCGRPGFVEVRIEDSGPGIPAEIAGRIFDPLFTTKAAGGGTGVGLALCHRIMVAHGGSISLADGQGTGACFVLELPTA